eukprot:3746668-Pleurochrysis_carterae.AAC.1
MTTTRVASSTARACGCNSGGSSYQACLDILRVLDIVLGRAYPIHTCSYEPMHVLTCARAHAQASAR